jgi:hypothetical protein
VKDEPERNPDMNGYEIIIGTCERDLFDEVSDASDNHRTYRASDGHLYTGIDSAEALYACSTACRDKLTAAYPEHGVIDDRNGQLDVHVTPMGRGYEDATVYPFTDDSYTDDMFPVRCSVCGHVMAGETD